MFTSYIILQQKWYYIRERLILFVPFFIWRNLLSATVLICSILFLFFIWWESLSATVLLFFLFLFFIPRDLFLASGLLFSILCFFFVLLSSKFPSAILFLFRKQTFLVMNLGKKTNTICDFLFYKFGNIHF